MIKYRLLVYVLMFSSSACAQASGDNAREGYNEQHDLRYLQQNFDQFYASEHAKFWSTLHEAANRARECRDVRQTTEFLGLARMARGNAEFNQFLSEIIEKLAANQTECFLSAWHRADEQAQVGVLQVLRSPLFVEPATLRKAFRPYEQGKYSDLVNQYLDSQKQ